MNDVLTGSILFFDGDDRKRFGKLFVATEEDDVFFHADSYCELAIFDDGLVHFDGFKKLECVPQKGDSIIFIKQSAQKGPRAVVWAFRETATQLLCQYKEAQRMAEIDAKFGKNRTVRLMAALNGVSPRVLWQGTDLTVCETYFPNWGGKLRLEGGLIFWDAWRGRCSEWADGFTDEEQEYMREAGDDVEVWFECCVNGAWIPFPDLRPYHRSLVNALDPTNHQFLWGIYK